jgi:hypothetical protein
MDNYFSAFPGSTMPNRLFVHSATSHGEINTDGTKYVPIMFSSLFVFLLDNQNFSHKDILLAILKIPFTTILLHLAFHGKTISKRFPVWLFLTNFAPRLVTTSSGVHS